MLLNLPVENGQRGTLFEIKFKHLINTRLSRGEIV